VIKPSLYCPGQKDLVYKVNGIRLNWMKRLTVAQVVRRQEEDDTVFDFSPAATE
jgi:hypothetical protein